MSGYTSSALCDIRDAIRLRRELPPPEERRALREAAGVSLAALGRACGVSHVAVHTWETGRKRPRGEHLRRYVDALRVLREESAP